MNALCGWIGLPAANGDGAAHLEGMARALSDDRPGVVSSVYTSCGGVAGAVQASRVTVHHAGRDMAVVVGDVTWKEPALRAEAAETGDACTFARCVRARGVEALDVLGDRFAVAAVDLEERRLMLATDRMGSIPLFYAVEADRLLFGSNVTSVLRGLMVLPPVDLQALYHYFVLACVPSPYSGFRDVHSLAPAEYLLYTRGTSRRATYWRPRFFERGHEASATHAELREVLASSVARCHSGGGDATFLSGGIDSTTILSLLTGATGGPVQCYSLGHEGSGASELPYARLAARTFGARLHECILTPATLLRAMQEVASASGVPCGNVSAPALLTLTRQAAADGVTTMIGGDGGDELFAGNVSYQLQRRLARWDRVPSFLRRILPSLIRALPGTSTLGPRAKAYVKRASIPLPERLWNWTAFFEMGAERLLSSEFLDAIDRTAPLALLQETYAQPLSATPLNRQLVTDWRFILHGNDLPRVRLACELAGLEIRFPMLGDEVVDLSLRIPVAEKMTHELRAFFKRGVEGLIPGEIIAKPKQGEVIPLEEWMRTDRPLREFTGDMLSSFRRRRIANPLLLGRLLDRSRPLGDGVPATLIHRMTMLEAWFTHHAD